MRVALLDSICDPHQPGASGLSDIVWRLAAELPGLGITPCVIGAYPAHMAPRRSGVEFRSVGKLAHRRENIATVVADRLALAIGARRAGCELFYAVDSLAAAALTIAGVGKRSVWHGHNNVLHHSQTSMPWDRPMYLAMLWASRYAAPRMGRIAVLGRSLVRWWTAFDAPTSRVVVVPNGVDIPPDESSHCVRGERSRNRPIRRIAYIGRLAPEKGGVKVLIDAMRAQNAAGANLTLEIAGDGPDRSALELAAIRANLAGAVRFLGMLSPSDVSTLYNRSDMVVLPSKGEMMPRVMLEAWAHKVAFMATAVGAIPDYLLDNVNGFLLRNATADTLSARLGEVRLEPSLVDRARHAGRSTAEGLTWSHAARALAHDAFAPIALA